MNIVENEYCLLSGIIKENKFEIIERLTELDFNNQENKELLRAFKESIMKYNSIEASIIFTYYKKLFNHYLEIQKYFCYSLNYHFQELKKINIFKKYGLKIDINENELKQALEIPTLEGNEKLENNLSIYENLFTMLKNENTIKTGIDIIDQATHGISIGQVMMFMATTSNYKTSTLLDIALNIVDQNKKVLFCTMEMTNNEMLSRLLQNRFKISYGKLIHDIKENSNEFIKKVNEILIEYNNLYFLDDSILTMDKLDRILKIYKPDVIFLDYIQSMTTGKEDIVKEFNTIAIGIKNLIKVHKCGCIVASQVSDVEDEYTEITLNKVRWSKTLGHSFDYVISMWLERDQEDQIQNLAILKNKRGIRRKIFKRSVNKESMTFNYNI